MPTSTTPRVTQTQIVSLIQFHQRNGNYTQDLIDTANAVIDFHFWRDPQRDSIKALIGSGIPVEPQTFLPKPPTLSLAMQTTILEQNQDCLWAYVADRRQCIYAQLSIAAANGAYLRLITLAEFKCDHLHDAHAVAAKLNNSRGIDPMTAMALHASCL